MLKNILQIVLFSLLFLLPIIIFLIYLPPQGKHTIYCGHVNSYAKVNKIQKIKNQKSFKSIINKNSKFNQFNITQNKNTSSISDVVTNSERDKEQKKHDKEEEKNTSSMFFDSILSESKQKLGDNTFEAIIVDNVLSEDECKEIIALCKNRFRSSHEYLTNKSDKTFRTSQTSSFYSHPAMKQIDQKISNILNLDDAYSETTQVQYYQKGQEFKPHTDYFTPNTKEYQKFAGKRGQRTYTVIAYLSDVDEGGDTIFTKMDIHVKPKLGRILVWNNQTDEGRVNPQSMHWGSPIVRGHKYILTKWYREKKN